MFDGNVNANADAEADAIVSAIALLVLCTDEPKMADHY